MYIMSICVKIVQVFPSGTVSGCYMYKCYLMKHLGLKHVTSVMKCVPILSTNIMAPCPSIIYYYCMVYFKLNENRVCFLFA